MPAMMGRHMVSLGTVTWFVTAHMIGNPLQFSRGAVKLTGNVYSQFRVPKYSIIVHSEVAVCCVNNPIFGQDQGIHLYRTGVISMGGFIEAG